MISHSEKITIEELVCDSSFQEYCHGSNLSSQLYWEEWLERNAHRRNDAEEARSILHILSAKQGNRSEQLKQLRDGLNQSEAFKLLISDHALQSVSNTADKKIKSLYKYTGAVAACLLMISAVFLLMPENAKQNKLAAAPVKKTTIIQSGPQARRTSILADGSLVTLNQNSSIQFNDNFGKETREVWLSGEAYFDVKHKELHPFIVHSTNNDIKVLGTIFNVKAYPGDPSSETFLIKGKVEVIPHDKQQKSVVLSPNQKLITSSVSRTRSLVSGETRNQVVSISRKKDAIEELQWVRNRLSIENEPLSAIAEKLETWYGIPIVFTDDEVKSLRYSGLFESESVIKSLEALQLSYPFAFEIHQDKIIISSK